MKTLTGILVINEKLKHSPNGNPNYSCSINGVTFSTRNDSDYNYSITNFEGREVEAEVRVWRNKLKLVSIKKHVPSAKEAYLKSQFEKIGSGQTAYKIKLRSESFETNWLSIDNPETLKIIEAALLADWRSRS